MTVRAGLDRLVSVYGSYRYTILFYTLLFTLGAAPLVMALGLNADLIEIFLAFNLLVGLLHVPLKVWRVLLIVVAAVAMGIAGSPMRALGEHVETGAVGIISGLAFLAAATAIRFAMRARAVGREQICAALSAYLLAGLFFGVLHWSVAARWPGSFGEAGRHGAQAPFTLSNAIYFSFVTLATLGYGDVVPKTEVARGLALIEAVGGQLYIAVMIASLVSMRVQVPGPADADDRGRGGGPAGRD